GGLARLGDRDQQVAWPDLRVAVPEFGSDVHLHRRTRKLFDQVFADQTGMPRGPAGHDPETMRLRELGRRQSDVRQVRFSLLIAVAPAQRLADRLGLLVDLLE